MALVEIDADGNELTPDFLRRRGLREACRAEIGLRLGNPDAEVIGRAALGDLVDAFFMTARATRGSLCARIGSARTSTVTIARNWTAAENEYELHCPIFALHRNVALSIAWTLDGSCSICGAGPFSCEHVPGECYDGEFCQLLYGGVLASIGR